MINRDLATYLLFMAKMEDPGDLASNLNLTNERIKAAHLNIHFWKL